MQTLLRGGRVIDPGTGFDGVADVLVTDGVVSAVAAGLAAPPGCAVVDVAGLVVGPGFIDLHSHVHSIAGQRLQAMDGVTTALDLEADLMPIERAYADAAAAGRPLHYGFSASWAAARAQVLVGTEPDARIERALAVLGNPGWQRSSSDRELAEWLALLERDLAAGALGIGVLLGYAPSSEPREFLAVARLAAKAGAPTYTHVRELLEMDPGTPFDGSEEIAVAAAETGAAMHHCHVNSTSGHHIDRVLDALDRSRRSGSRVTVEAYPYGAGSTAIGAAFIDAGRLKMKGLSPSSVVLLETGERVADEGRLRQLRNSDPAAPVILEFLDEEDPRDLALLHSALAFPDAIVASDAMPVSWKDSGRKGGRDGSHESTVWPLPPGGTTHPRTAGTFAKTLRVMVREREVWDWPEAFRRCSHLPARVLDEVAPGARAKGHLGVGADADIVAIDPAAITDAATYADPTRPSVGVRHLLVAGVPVVSAGELRTDAFPGQPLRGEPR
ncbi:MULTISPECIES: amidohydrolase family protein [unclassified Streptomyces]|uniref:amidohydrolase family protein n=1 Tax=unclassified Streptomyces TaxID=2593676 RepID=UPI00081EBB0D|nr:MULTISPECIES: amidohydrolase family protein [unclassified Streptomyces]MYZ39573.1 amidohydrolase family protein [Streptomyces sp. SID4917]SCG04374.1 N-acyl-D-aspartate/D-glutamate deacylase [Streptomyces sp. MnatMP-M17]